VNSAWTELFNPAAYRVVLFDQRGCGRSTPSAARTADALNANTTRHLIADIESLRRHLAIDRWLVLGASWGSILGLTYAQTHPRSVSELVLFSVVAGTQREVDWATRGMGRFFPTEWKRFQAGVPDSERDGDLSAAYYRLLLDPDPAVYERAARNWCDWDDRQMRNAAKLTGIPGILIRGALDFGPPIDVFWPLARDWPESDLIVIDEEGHLGGAAMDAALVSATDRFARRTRE
jgi:proline iminopeptidase